MSVHNQLGTRGMNYKKECLNYAECVLRHWVGAPEHSIIEPFTSFKVTVLLASL